MGPAITSSSSSFTQGCVRKNRRLRRTFLGRCSYLAGLCVHPVTHRRTGLRPANVSNQTPPQPSFLPSCVHPMTTTSNTINQPQMIVQYVSTPSFPSFIPCTLPLRPSTFHPPSSPPFLALFIHSFLAPGSTWSSCEKLRMSLLTTRRPPRFR